MDEDVLRFVPSERPRFTALGGIVLGTALISGLSMWLALSTVAGPSLLFILPVVIWTFFTANLDRWMVAMSPGQARLASIVRLLPRLLLSLLLGVTVGEPLVMRIFATEIERQAAANGLDGRPLSLLEEFELFSQLIDTNTTMAIASWTVRLLLVVVFALPVLTRFLGGMTIYDELVEQRFHLALKLHHSMVSEEGAAQVDKLAEQLVAAQQELQEVKRQLALANTQGS